MNDFVVLVILMCARSGASHAVKSGRRKILVTLNYYDVERLHKNFYHDERRLAAVIISDEDGTINVEGVIGPNLKIKPTESFERSEHGRRAHIIEAIEDGDPVRVYGKLREQEVTVHERASSGKTGFDPSKYAVEIIFPEIFFVCDSWFRSGFRTNESMIGYLMVTLKVVNLRYRPLRSPRIQLVLRGIELSHWTQEHRYDMIVLGSNRREESLGGYAFVASVCSDHRMQLGEDKAHTYKGIRITAHEVAHTLGCSHDGTSAPGVAKTFVPNSLGCPWEDGYIMSYMEEDSRSMKFSSCCKYDMAQMSWAYEGWCLHTNDSKVMPLNWKNRARLPGEFLNRDVQCRLTYPDLYRTHYMRSMGSRNCLVYCFVPGDQYGGADHRWPMYLIDGSPCGHQNKSICINGDCVPDRRRKRRPRT
ncbi:venom metalloproteinase antarease-like TtrivMP_A isoform X2 [Dermacentor andersoni]|uniref:venom metalloproteinase antarease-like TtrivMP_A isoform X2 n=1 Tax=Dermacentor andersoni TaxID=34620 RepID=UPI002417C4E1|nr:A disintegrin and metalloproteinase with thrombospondin motifs like isoform X2 [Dermacentor andersoni]